MRLGGGYDYFFLSKYFVVKNVPTHDPIARGITYMKLFT